MKPSPWAKGKSEKPTNLQILEDLARSIQAEEDAIKDYKERAETARLAGDMETVKVYEHIIPQEAEHFMEFSQRVRELGGGE